MSRTFVRNRRVRTDDASGRLFRGIGDGPRPGILLCHGAGGAGGYEQRYAAMLAEHGYTVFCVEYFGAPGVRDALLEVPVEEFGDAAEWLLDRPTVSGDAVGVIGFSRGGEAALLVGSQFDTVGVVAAYVPSCYAWAAPSWMDGVGDDRPSWTLDGDPVPYLNIDEYVPDDKNPDDPLTSDGHSACSLALEGTTEAAKERATIPVEAIDGPVLLVSGGSDTVWPSSLFADRAAARLGRNDHAWQFDHLAVPDAGHAIRVPYRFDEETPLDGTHAYGGTHSENARASALAWRRTLQYLDRALGPSDAPVVGRSET